MYHVGVIREPESSFAEVMDPERWQQVKDLFQSAMDVPPGERSPYVSAACGDDKELRSEVESLIAAEGKADQFIRRPELARRTLQDAIMRTDPMGRATNRFVSDREPAGTRWNGNGVLCTKR